MNAIHTLAFVGDIFLERPEPATIFGPTAKALAADVLFGNCETPISEVGEQWRGKPLANNCLKMTPEMVAGFTALGFDAVGLASNHSLDYGAEAILRTRELLEAAGVRTCGAGHDLDEAHRPAIVHKDGLTVAFLAYCSVFMPGWEATEDRPGIAVVRVETGYKPHPRIHEQPGSPATTLTIPHKGDVERLASDVRAAKQQADLVVVTWHWGVSERYGKLVPYQIELGHLALDEGADILIGHHPHMLQGVEIHNGKPLFYSLGNFAFDFPHPWFGPESVIVRCDVVRKRIERVSVVPCMIGDDCVPRPLGPKDNGPVLLKLQETSADFLTDFRTDANQIVIS